MSDGGWETVDADGRIVTARYRFVGGQSRTTVVRTGDDAIVYSPGRPLVEHAREATGDASRIWLIAPSVGHTLGVAAWRERYASARVVAASSTAARLRKRGLDDMLEPSAFPLDGAGLLQPASNGTGELWLQVNADDRIHWIVADAYLNLVALAPGFVLRTLQRLYGLRTGLSFGRAFRSALADRTAFPAWLEQTLDLSARHVLIPCHGEVDAAPDLRDRLLTVSRT